MSRLQDLIAELCPDGVEYVQLCDVARYAKTRIDATEVDESTYVGVENLLQNKMGKTFASTVPTTGNVIAFEKGNILIGNIRPYLRKIWLADCNGGTNGDVLTIQINDDNKVKPEFLFYILSSEQFFSYDTQNSKGAKMPRGDKTAVMKYTIPVPPLPVQSEIVRILDNFAELTAKLTAKLAAELTARKKQYVYYRKLLFTNKEYKYLTLGEVANTFRGQFITKKNTNLGDTPVILGGQEPAYYIDQSNHNGEIVVIARSGASAGFVSYWNEPIFVTDGFGYEAKDGVIVSKYLYYALKNIEQELNNMKRGAGVPHVSGEALLQVKIPVPSLERQKEIIDIVDRFDTFCIDISTGLPAEIEARQKQYEYYRDKLLTFKELS